MRIRSIKPEFWRSDDIKRVPREYRLLFIGLWSYVDDNGVGVDDYRQIAADLFALEDDPTETRDWVRDGLAILSRGSQEGCNPPLVARYQVAGKSYLYITGWDHQRVDRPNKPRYPIPSTEQLTSNNAEPEPEQAESSRDHRETPLTGTGEQGNRGTGDSPPSGVSARTRATRIPDDFAITPAMVDWARQRVPAVNGRTETEKFINYWRAKSGKDATKHDWDATWRNWMLRAAERAPTTNGHPPRSTADERFLAAQALKQAPRLEIGT